MIALQKQNDKLMQELRRAGRPSLSSVDREASNAPENNSASSASNSAKLQKKVRELAEALVAEQKKHRKELQRKDNQIDEWKATTENLRQELEEHNRLKQQSREQERLLTTMPVPGEEEQESGVVVVESPPIDNSPLVPTAATVSRLETMATTEQLDDDELENFANEMPSISDDADEDDYGEEDFELEGLDN